MNNNRKQTLSTRLNRVKYVKHLLVKVASAHKQTKKKHTQRQQQQEQQQLNVNQKRKKKKILESVRHQQQQYHLRSSEKHLQKLIKYG